MSLFMRAVHTYRRTTKGRAMDGKLYHRRLSSRMKKRWRKHGKGQAWWY